MGNLAVQLATLGLGVAASPLPIVAVLVILLSKRAFPGSLTLAISWVLGVVVALVISIRFSASIRVPGVGADIETEGVFALLLGIGLVVMGALLKRGRHRSPSGGEPPAWVNSVDDLSPVGAGLLAFANATTSPKNLAFAITAGRAATESTVLLYRAIPAILVYIAIASSSIVIPVAIYILGGQRSVALLESWREKITAHAAAIMEIMLFVLGIGLSVKGLYNLLG